MSPIETSGRTTAVAALTALVGLALLARPRRVVTTITGDDAASPAVAVARVLGGRYLLQGVAVVVRPGTVLPVAPWVDVLHAASMLPLLAVPRHRRLAAVSAAIALVVAAGSRWADQG